MFEICGFWNPSLKFYGFCRTHGTHANAVTVIHIGNFVKKLDRGLLILKSIGNTKTPLRSEFCINSLPDLGNCIIVTYILGKLQSYDLDVVSNWRYTIYVLQPMQEKKTGYHISEFWGFYSGVVEFIYKNHDPCCLG